MPREGTDWLGVLAKVLVAALVLGGVTVALMPSLGPHTVSRNEAAAVAALRSYLSAQNVFHKDRFYGE